MNHMEKAIELSRENVSSGKGGPFGCVIVSNNNEIISVGKNEVICNNDPSAHAEIVAIRNACKKRNSPFLNDCVIYTSCEPCPMCYGAIKWAKINKIFYCNTRKDAQHIGFDDNFIYDEIINQRQNMIQLNHPQGIKAFEEWEQCDKKKVY